MSTQPESIEHDPDMVNLADQIANSFAKQVDLHLNQFLKKNKIPFDGNIKTTMKLLEDMGMMLIRQDENDGYFGDQTTTYKLVQVIDSTKITIKSPFNQ